MAEELFRIGELAARAGVSERTLRYYEELGLISPSGVSPGGFRLYTETDLRRVLVIKVFKDLGLSLEQIRELLQPDPGRGRAERVAFSARVLQAQVAVLESRIKELEHLHQQARQALAMLEKCTRCPQESCPPHCPNRQAFV